jgi:hypothetical protein
MARIPVWEDVCRSGTGRFAAREICRPEASCSCTTPVSEVVLTVGTGVAKQTASEAAKGTVRNFAPIAATIVLAESLYVAVEFRRGKISKREAINQVVGSCAGGAGSVGGAAAGAAIGTVILPVVGTAIGSYVGSVLGGVGARFAARRAMASTGEANAIA